MRRYTSTALFELFVFWFLAFSTPPQDNFRLPRTSPGYTIILHINWVSDFARCYAPNVNIVYRRTRLVLRIIAIGASGCRTKFMLNNIRSIRWAFLVRFDVIIIIENLRCSEQHIRQSIASCREIFRVEAFLGLFVLISLHSWIFRAGDWLVFVVKVTDNDFLWMSFLL